MVSTARSKGLANVRGRGCCSGLASFMRLWQDIRSHSYSQAQAQYIDCGWRIPWSDQVSISYQCDLVILVTNLSDHPFPSYLCQTLDLYPDAKWESSTLDAYLVNLLPSVAATSHMACLGAWMVNQPRLCRVSASLLMTVQVVVDRMATIVQRYNTDGMWV